MRQEKESAHSPSSPELPMATSPTSPEQSTGSLGSVPLNICLSEEDSLTREHSCDAQGGTSQVLFSGHFRNDRLKKLDTRDYLDTLPPQLKMSSFWRHFCVYSEMVSARQQAKVDICREAGRKEGLALVSVHRLPTTIPGHGGQDETHS